MQIELRNFVPLLTAVVTLIVATTMAETATKVPLPELAARRFGHLSAAEEELFDGAVNGRVADCTHTSGNDHVIRGDLLSWLCTDASAYVKYGGIFVKGAEIDGKVNLDWAKISFPIVAEACVFNEEIRLGHSRLVAFYLVNTFIKDLKARGVMVESGVYLSDGFKAQGEVDLESAIIGGDLNCTYGQFASESNTPALFAAGARIGGSVVLSDGFKAHGTVNLVHATIGENLVCTNGQFVSDSKAPALVLGGARIESSVFLDNGFKADGGVNLELTNIGGGLDCTGGQFVGKGEAAALAGSEAKISGDVYLMNGFKADGTVILSGATIGSNLDCDGGQFINKEPTPALIADDVNVRGSVYLNSGFKSVGAVSFARATIGGNLECENSQLVGEYTYALEAENAKISGNVIIDAGSVADGEVAFLLANVAGEFRWGDRTSSEKAKLNLRLTKVGKLSNDQGSWPKPGNLEADGFVYDQIDDAAHPNAKVQLGWISRQPGDRFRSQPYEQLAAVLRKMGLDDDARQVMITKNDEHGRYLQSPIWDWHRPWNLNKLFEWFWYRVFGNVLVGYGYQPWRAFVISIGVILLGWSLFHRGYIRGLVTPKGSGEYVVEKDGTHPLLNSYPKFNGFVYSLETFVPLIKLGLSDYWAPNANRGAPATLGRIRLPLTTGGALCVYLWFHIIAGWVLTTLWVGGLTGLVKT
jgi:sRNA-binding regulator protein Hfq